MVHTCLREHCISLNINAVKTVAARRDHNCWTTWVFIVSVYIVFVFIYSLQTLIAVTDFRYRMVIDFSREILWTYFVELFWVCLWREKMCMPLENAAGLS